MAINSVSEQSSASSGRVTGASGNSVEQTKEQFLQMLITQLQYQDPFSPADSSQFTQQMMQMGQLEQLLNLNEGVQSMASAQQGALISQYSDIVGKSVVATGNQMQISGADKGVMTFSLPSTPSDVRINVFDSYGNMVRDFSPGVSVSGNHSVKFDGKNSQGQDLADGYYTFTVDALDQNSDTIVASTFSTGQISSIRLEKGTPVFQMGGKDVSVTDIQKIF